MSTEAKIKGAQEQLSALEELREDAAALSEYHAQHGRNVAADTLAQEAERLRRMEAEMRDEVRLLTEGVSK